MNLFKYIICLLFIFVNTFLFSEVTTIESNPENKKEENNKILKKPKSILNFDKSLIIKTFIRKTTQNLQLEHYYQEGDDTKYSKRIEYEPNVGSVAGVSLSYYGYGFSVSTGMKDSTLDEETYGKTRFIDFSFSMYKRKYGFDFFIGDYKGYFLKDRDYYNISKEDKDGVRSDLQTSVLGFNAFYIFSDTFSFSAAFNQSEKQLKSSGSFLLMFSFRGFSVKSDYALIPASQQIKYEDDAGFTGGEFASLGLSAGYAYAFIYNNYYFTPAIFWGFGTMEKKYKSGDKERIKSESYSSANIRFSVGYNSEQYFGGINGFGDLTTTEAFEGDGLKVSIMNIFVEIFAGIRL